MFKGLPSFGTPLALKLARVCLKLTVGILFVTFFLNYQPVFNSFPQIKKSVVYAEGEQSQAVSSQSLPIVFQLPFNGYLSNPFSSWHPGVDIATGLGTPIKPIAAGTVSDTGFSFFGYGMYVEVDHGHGYKSFYAHLGRLYVQKGQTVAEDTYLGEVGLTGNTSGPHTHLEVYKDGTRIDPQTILPPLRKMPQSQDFVSRVSSTESAALAKNYQGGATSVPTLGTVSSPKPTAQPTTSPTPVTKINDTLSIQSVLSSPQPKKPAFLSL